MALVSKVQHAQSVIDEVLAALALPAKTVEAQCDVLQLKRQLTTACVALAGYAAMAHD